nr:hypothetical protein Q903MT_gene1767 [Picea sitchensis]
MLQTYCIEWKDGRASLHIELLNEWVSIQQAHRLPKHLLYECFVGMAHSDS